MNLSSKCASVARATRTFLGDVAEGLFQVTHNGFALVGLSVVVAVGLLAMRPDLRAQGEERLTEWLVARKLAEAGDDVPAADPEAIERVTAVDPNDLPQEQARVAYWIAKKYRVAPEPLAALVAEAYELGPKVKLDPTLILAVMAVESNFNPFAQSHVGAQGLMQVMTEVHSDKYQDFGGQFAAFDPVSNLRVGVRVLQECIARAGSVPGGLKYYVGASNLPSDGGYAAKVLAEHARIFQVAKGRPLTDGNSSGSLQAQADKPAPLPVQPAASAASAPAGSAAPLEVAVL
ncbi:MAG: lytic transglycosylase domain-containing protein [Burkholderiaceae bacterium]|jgi:hypothetical protein|nr:lytic transglycosylase domain-containing protein [Burkholderiaceae bacterium]